MFFTPASQSKYCGSVFCRSSKLFPICSPKSIVMFIELFGASWMTQDFLLFLENKYVPQKPGLLKECSWDELIWKIQTERAFGNRFEHPKTLRNIWALRLLFQQVTVWETYRELLLQLQQQQKQARFRRHQLYFVPMTRHTGTSSWP